MKRHIREARSRLLITLANTLVCLAFASTTTNAQSNPTNQDFGSAVVGAQQVTVTLTYSFVGLLSTPTFAMAYGTDFSYTAVSCQGGTQIICSLQMAFTANFPGVRQDALIAKDTSGNVLAVTFVHGIGVGGEPAASPGLISTLAGSGAWNYTGDNGPAVNATFRNPQGLAIDGRGNVYISDSVNHVVRRIDTDSSVVTTVAGTGEPGYSGDGAVAILATLNTPIGICLDSAGNLYIADSGNNRIRKVNTATGIITTVAGGGNSGSGSDSIGNGGPATSARLYGPSDVAVDSTGNIYVADSFHNLVRKISEPSGIITIVAGGGTSTGADGVGDGGLATDSILNDPSSVALDALGNVYVADTGNNLVRIIDASSHVIRAVVGNTIAGYSGDGLVATTAQISAPSSIRLDAAGDLYIADYGNGVIREVNSANQTIMTLEADGNTIVSPIALALNPQGIIYIADYDANRVLKITRNPGTLTFPTTNVGEISNAQSLSVVNIGNADLMLTAPDVGSNFAQQSSASNDCSLAVLPPGNTCSLTVAFAPREDGSIAEKLVVNSLNAAGSIVVGLGGVGVGTASIPVIEPTYWAFGSQPLGSSSAIKTFRVSNAGNAPLLMSSVTLIGANADFAIITNSCTAGVAPGNDCAISVSFIPTALGNRSATLVLVDSALDSPQSVNLSGNGTPGMTAIAVSDQSLSFNSNPQSLVLSAAVTSPAGVVNGGTVTFSVFNGSMLVGASVDSQPVNSGRASVTYNLPAGMMVGAYSIIASYTGSGDFAASTDATHSIKVYPAGSTISASNTYLPFSVNVQSVRLSALVTSAAGIVNEGTVTFTVLNNGNPIGLSAVSNSVAAGNASAMYLLPAGTAVGEYTISAVYTSAQDFGGSSDSSHMLTLDRAPTITVGSAASAVESVADQTVTLYATIASTAGPVNDGTVQFTVFGGATMIGSPVTSGIVRNGTAIANYVLPAYTPAGTYEIQTAYSGQQNFAASSDESATFTVTPPVSGLGALMFVPVTPCRVADTRNAEGPFGGPQLTGGVTRDFVVPNSTCGIPTSALAYSLNVTVVPSTSLGYLTIWPAGEVQPTISTLNSLDGRIKANAAIVPAGLGGAISIQATDTTQVLIDVNGYFVPAGTASSLAFYSVTPCRVADTRVGSGPLSGPSLTGGTSRSFPILSSGCNIPGNAQAYSLNITAVPKEPLYYITTWPSGQSQPNVSTLNAPTGAITANAAIVPAGIGGSVSIYASNDTDLVMDINGYFSVPGTGGLSLYTLTPCRLLDTRAGSQPLNGTLRITVADGKCGAPATAQAYTVNATVIPTSILQYLTLWADGGTEPLVSTLNSLDGTIASNMAIVPTNNGFIDAFGSNSTDLILDLSSYFAP